MNQKIWPKGVYVSDVLVIVMHCSMAACIAAGLWARCHLSTAGASSYAIQLYHAAGYWQAVLACVLSQQAKLWT